MITRLSELFVRTLRDDPADAEVPSHKLLIRAGYVRPIAPGVYSWLPLGLRVLRKIENIVREEMNAIGGQEILLPALLPRAPYETTNRWTEYGDSLFRLKDRRDNDMMLGPTHEELFALTVKGEYSSYKDFPVILYQVQTKYRDEARPRAGILRGREFVMKDSYSFDTSDDGLKTAYHAHREAYQRIFGRLGLDYVIVAATSGAMGGSASEEFLAESPTGEDTFVRCVESGYAANVEAVITPAPPARSVDGLPAAVVHETGDTPTIATLVDWANSADLGATVTAADTLKNILLKVRQPGGDVADVVDAEDDPVGGRQRRCDDDEQGGAPADPDRGHEGQQGDEQDRAEGGIRRVPARVGPAAVRDDRVLRAGPLHDLLAHRTECPPDEADRRHNEHRPPDPPTDPQRHRDHDHERVHDPRPAEGRPRTGDVTQPWRRQDEVGAGGHAPFVQRPGPVGRDEHPPTQRGDDQHGERHRTQCDDDAAS